MSIVIGTSIDALPTNTKAVCDHVDCERSSVWDFRYESGIHPNSNWLATRQGKMWYHYCSIHKPEQLHYDEVINSLKEKEPTQTIKKGLQSDIETVFSRADPEAMLALGRVLAFGERKYQYADVPLGQENWRLIDQRSHMDHAMEHLWKEFREMNLGRQVEGDEDAGTHLEHALCRIMFALGVKLDATLTT